MVKPRKRSEVLKEKLDTVKKSQEQKSVEQETFIAQCFNTVAGSEEGRIVFRELARLCGFRRSKVVASSVEKIVDPVSTTFNCMGENIYLKMTKRVRREYLIKIEYPFLKQPE